MDLAEKVERLRRAGLRVGYALRVHSLRGTLNYSDVEDDGQYRYRTGDDGVPFVDLSRVAMGPDTYGQTVVWLRSNFRSLQRDYPETFLLIGWSNVDALGAYVEKLNDDMVALLAKLADEYPIYDEEDMSSMEDDEISEAWNDYLRFDVRRDLTDEECEVFDSLDADELRDAFYTALSDADCYPEHDGYDVHWDETEVLSCVRDAMATLTDRVGTGA